MAILAAANCLWVAVLFGTSQLSPGQSAWSLFPLPGLYLAEIALIGIFTLFAVWEDTNKWAAGLPVAAGILLAFYVLGGFSIGPYLLPALIAQGALIILWAKEHRAKITTKLAIILGAAIGQGGVMLLAINYI